MSAESPRKPSRQGGHIVAPQPVSDKSIIESVAGFINEVVPQGYSSSSLSENKEQITWARFEYADINDPALYPDTTDDRNGTAPLLLVLGYGSGVQVWAIPASGEATEVLSWRQGVVRTLRVLPTPTASTPDTFAPKRPLVALCDSSSPGPQFCSLSFISLRAGDQVKSIKFKNPVNDVLANGRSIVVSFSERIAVFDASTLEDRLTITTCYPCPGSNPNPVALGPRWLAYAERRLIPSKRCSGGTEGEGIQSYTATVLHAAKSLGKGLRELGETVASSLTGGLTPPGSRSITSAGQPDSAEVLHPGIVTIVDAQGTWKENGRMEDNVIAHFTGHAEAIVALQFDPSGILLVTADKRGHDFHLFRIQPHPGGSSLAAVHHLYVLHRGDTTAKVQDIAFASDSRWVAVSTLRGTTHVFPITPYGGGVGLRTHSTPHVVNRLSRFHRSAGLTADGRNSPQPHETQAVTQAMPYPNPRLPPYPHPTVVAPLAQIRQPLMHLSTPSSPNPSNAYHRNPSVRALGRNQSSSDESGGIPLRVSACFAPSRAWLVGSPTVPRDTSNRSLKKAVDSLFVMACHGNLIEYDLETKHAAGIPKEKVCDDTPIELEVQAKAQWLLLRPPQSSEVQPPLSGMNPLMVPPSPLPYHPPVAGDISDERWLSHVEIITHAGPHRRLWMGPQFTFKTYTANTGVCSALVEPEGVDIGSGARLARSNPVNMPVSNTARPVVPFLIESGSGGSYEQSPRLLEVYGGSTGGDSDGSAGPGETQLREELADAMLESPGVPTRDTGRRVIVELQGGRRSQTIPIEKIVNPVGTVLTIITDEGNSDGKTIDGENMETTVRWPTDVMKIIPKPIETLPTKKKRGKISNASSTTLEEKQSIQLSKSLSSGEMSKSSDVMSLANNVTIPSKQVSKVVQDESEKKVSIVHKVAATGGSKFKESSVAMTKDEEAVFTNTVEEKETKRKDPLKDSKCRDKPSGKDTSKKYNDNVREKNKNQKTRKPIAIEVNKDVTGNIIQITRSRSSSKSSDNNTSESTVSSSRLEMVESKYPADSEKEKEVSEMKMSDLDASDRILSNLRARSSSNSSDGYNVEDACEINVQDSVLKLSERELELISENDKERPEEKQVKSSIQNQSKSRENSEEKERINNLATNVQSYGDKSLVKLSTNSPFQSMVELPFKASTGVDIGEKSENEIKSIIFSSMLDTNDAVFIPEPKTALSNLNDALFVVKTDGETTDSEQNTFPENVLKPLVEDDKDSNEGITKVVPVSVPVPMQRRIKGKGKNAASKVNNEVVLGSSPKSEKPIKTQARTHETRDMDEEAENLPISSVLPIQLVEADASNVESIAIVEVVNKPNTSEWQTRASQSDEKMHKGKSPSKDFDIDNEENTENVTLKPSLARKPKKSELLPKDKKRIETELNTSQVFEEPSMTTIDADDIIEPAALSGNLRARKYQALDLEDVKKLSVELPSRVVNKRVSKIKFKPFDMPVVSVLNVDVVDVKCTAQKSNVDDFPDLNSSKDIDSQSPSEDVDKSSNVWTNKSTSTDKKGSVNIVKHVLTLKSNDVSKQTDEEPKKIIAIEDVDDKSSLSNLAKIRLSPPKLWSSIASSKSKPEKQQCDSEVFLSSTAKNWSTKPAADQIDVKLPSEIGDGDALVEESCELESTNGVDDLLSMNNISSEQISGIETVVSNDSDSPTLLQANKKNNKKKNKKRR